MITDREVFAKGLLTARPVNRVLNSEVKRGTQVLRLNGFRDGQYYVPKNYSANRSSSLAVMLHGAGGQAGHGLHLLKKYADEYNIILVAPASHASTWDIIAKNSFNGDVIYIDQALLMMFNEYNIDAAHIAIGGFSDGASYALSLGLSNGDLFTHIIAFSPGFYFIHQNIGKPKVYISHGVKDEVLPIAPCSGRIVPRLKRLKYDVDYHEFYGEHEIPEEISGKAVNWFLR